MNSQMTHQQLMLIIRHALFVMLICYLPHFYIGPWWLFLLVILAIVYKLAAEYFAYPLINKWIRGILVITCISLLKLQYGSIISSGFFIGFFLTFTALKVVETHSIRDIKVLILCNFYLIFTSLIVIQELWIMIYLLISLLANLSLMLKISAPMATLGQLGTSSLKQILIAIPLSMILFYVFPRLTNPLWQVPSLVQGSMGFSETMNPGSIRNLFTDDSTAFRAVFKGKPVLKGYWKGLVFAFYNGKTWSPVWHVSSNFPPLQLLRSEEKADYQVVMEPTHKKWLFYLGYPKYAYPDLQFSSSFGLVSKTKEVINQRFAYSIATTEEPMLPLSSREWKQNVQVPKYLNPQLYQWSQEQFAKTENNPERFVSFLKNYIQHEEYWYTLNPPVLTGSRNSMDEFWFNTKKGFCEHYASAVTLILRSAGIPARVVVGYQGGEWNPISNYLTVKQKNAHAWLEYWTNEQGWQRFDPTAYISPSRVDIDLLSNTLEQESSLNVSAMGWWQRSKLMMDSANFFVERWLLFYNQETQQDLLDNLGLTSWGISQLFQVAVFSLVLFIILMGLYYWWQQRKSVDPVLVQYRLLKKELHRFHVYSLPSSTLRMSCAKLMLQLPSMDVAIESFINQYEHLRLIQTGSHSSKNIKETVALFKGFRRQLARVKTNKK